MRQDQTIYKSLIKLSFSIIGQDKSTLLVSIWFGTLADVHVLGPSIFVQKTNFVCFDLI